LLLSAMTTTTEKIAELLDAAQAEQDHVALGYASWPAYVAGEFADALAGLSTAARRPAVVALAEGGLSTRAIAEIAGVGQSTVGRDLQVTRSGSPEQTRPQARSANLPEKQVTGMDGKSYSAASAESRKPRRSPLPDSYRRTTWELRKWIERLEKLHADDRFQTNRKELANNGGANLMVECSQRLTELVRHLSGVDRQLGEYRPAGRAKYFGGA